MAQLVSKDSSYNLHTIGLFFYPHLILYACLLGIAIIAIINSSFVTRCDLRLEESARFVNTQVDPFLDF